MPPTSTAAKAKAESRLTGTKLVIAWYENMQQDPSFDQRTHEERDRPFSATFRRRVCERPKHRSRLVGQEGSNEEEDAMQVQRYLIPLAVALIVVVVFISLS